jgi:hypothetical protein
MPKSPIWEAESGPVRVEEYYTNSRGSHYELRVGNGHQVVIFPHELKALRGLLNQIEAHENAPALALEERRRA